MLVRTAQSSRYHDLIAARPPLAHSIFRKLHMIAVLDNDRENDDDPWSSPPMIDRKNARLLDLRRLLNQIECAHYVGHLYEKNIPPYDAAEWASHRYYLNRHCIVGAFAVHAELTQRELHGIPVQEEMTWWLSVMKALKPASS